MNMRKNEARRTRRESDVLKGLIAGLAGGLAASVVMNQFQALLGKLGDDEVKGHGAQSLQQGAPQHGVARVLQERGGKEEEDDDATERVADAISQGVFNHKLTEREKDVAGTGVHYAFGVTTGGLYGAMSELAPGVMAGAGLPLGAFVWLTADEGIVPALGLSRLPTEYPLSTHAYSLASHLVYGLTAEIVRRVVREAL